MPNEQNLIPVRSTEEARERGRNGGRASGVSRRRKKSMREAADMLLSLPVSDRRMWNKIAKTGVDPEDIDNQMAAIIGTWMSAVKGDSKAMKVLMELVGDPVDESESAQQVREHRALMDAIKKAAEDEI